MNMAEKVISLLSAVRDEGACPDRCSVTSNNKPDGCSDSITASDANNKTSDRADGKTGTADKADSRTGNGSKDQVVSDYICNTDEPPSKIKKLDIQDESVEQTVDAEEKISKTRDSIEKCNKTVDSSSSIGSQEKHLPMPLFYYDVQKKKYSGYPK